MTASDPRRRHPPRRAGELLRGVTAAVAVIALVVGVPAVLGFLTGALPVRRSMPDPGSLLTRPDDGSLFLLALFAVAWLAWAVFAVSVAVETVAVVRNLPTPRLPGLRLPQQGAAALVAAAAVLLTPAAPGVLAAPTARAVAAAPPAPADPVRDAARAAQAAGSRRTAAAPHAQASASPRPNPTVTVQRHDTLWSLAEQHLGSGERYTEIVELNRGLPQPDGRALRDADWIYPGWHLRLPPDARVPTPPPDPPAAAGAQPGTDQETYVVRRGDSLWEIAEERVGSG